MNIDITKIVDTVKDIGIAGGASFAGMSGLDSVKVHPDEGSDLLIKSIVAVVAGILTRLLTRLFRKKK